MAQTEVIELDLKTNSNDVQSQFTQLRNAIKKTTDEVEQLTMEFGYNSVELKQATQVKKYIGFHDTYSQGAESLDIPGRLGINYAINEFLENNDEWRIKEKFLNNNGLLIIERVK
jgi:hypothetical protein